MKKFGVVVASVLGLLVLGGVIVVVMISDVTKSLIEKIGSEALGVRVAIESLDIRLTEQSVSVRGIEIGNPTGYEGGNLIYLAAIDVALGDVSSDLIRFKKISVSGSEVNLKVSEKGTNFGALKKNIAKNGSGKESSASASTSSSDSSSKAPKVIIDKFLFEKATVNPTVTLMGKDQASAKVVVPDISLSGIGQKENGIVAKEALAQIFNHISSKVESVALDGGLLKGMNADALKSLGGDMMNKVKESGISSEGLKDAAKGFLGSLGQ